MFDNELSGSGVDAPGPETSDFYPASSVLPITPQTPITIERNNDDGDGFMLDPNQPPDALRLGNWWHIPVHCEMCGSVFDERVHNDAIICRGWRAQLQDLHLAALCPVCWVTEIVPGNSLDPAYAINDDTDTLIDTLQVERDSWRDLAGMYGRELAHVRQRLDVLEGQNAELQRRIMTLIDRLTAAPAQVTADRLGQADVDALDLICRSYTADARALPDLLAHLNMGDIATFRERYLSREDAQRALWDRIVDTGAPVLAHRVQTMIARNGTPYLSLDCGFGSIAIFNADVHRVFANSRAHAYVDEWRQIDFKAQFPAVVVTPGREGVYPRVVSLEDAT